MQEAIRAKDQPLVNVLRILLDEFDDAQKVLGKQAFDATNLEEPVIQPDRQQVLIKMVVQEIMRREIQQRQEYVELLITGGQKEKADCEGIKISILEDCLNNNWN